jgi:hypothetical protein
MKLENVHEFKQRAIKVFAELDTERDRLKTDLSNLDTPEKKKQYAPNYLREQAIERKTEAKNRAIEQRETLRVLREQLESGRSAWDTKVLMRKARFVPSDGANGELLEELKRLRYNQELPALTHDELIAELQEAKHSKNLALLSMLSREAGRRKPEDPTMRIALQAAVEDAITSVEIPSQKAVLNSLAEAEQVIEAGEDAFTELVTGTEPPRARMRRVMAKAE